MEPEALQGQQHRVLADNAFNGHSAREQEQAGDGKILTRELTLFKDSIVLFYFFSKNKKTKPKKSMLGTDRFQHKTAKARSPLDNLKDRRVCFWGILGLEVTTVQVRAPRVGESRGGGGVGCGLFYLPDSPVILFPFPCRGQ